jgi:pyruvate/2-oxoglutarate dehydrogenase complex dihydrolipoamide dehydrogenase (E3) component
MDRDLGSDYDVVVVGGGTGGLSSAREARRRGATVALVQEGRLGGDCTFTGCVPSKALLAAAARGQSFDEAMAEVHRAVETIAATEDDAALARTGVDVLHGRGVFRSPTLLDVDGRSVRSTRFIVATGAVLRSHPSTACARRTRSPTRTSSRWTGSPGGSPCSGAVRSAPRWARPSLGSAPTSP